MFENENWQIHWLPAIARGHERLLWHDRRILNEEVETRVLALETLGERLHRREARKVEEPELDV